MHRLRMYCCEFRPNVLLWILFECTAVNFIRMYCCEFHCADAKDLKQLATLAFWIQSSRPDTSWDSLSITYLRISQVYNLQFGNSEITLNLEDCNRVWSSKSHTAKIYNTGINTYTYTYMYTNTYTNTYTYTYTYTYVCPCMYTYTFTYTRCNVIDVY